MNDATTATTAPAPAPEADTSLLGSAAPAPAPTSAPAPPAAPAAGTPGPSPAPTPAPSAAPGASPAPSPAPTPAPSKPEQAAGAPAKYADFKLPETLKADEPLMGKFSDWAKTHNLSQDAAQAAVDLAAEMQTSSAQAIMTAQKAAVTEFYAPIGGDPATWAAQARADKEIGGDKFNENLALAAQARDQFGTPELKKVLNVMKIGDHPEVLRFFVRAGKAISQDGFVPGRASNGARKSDAEVIYGSQTTH